MTERFLLIMGSICLSIVTAISISIVQDTAFLVASVWTYVIILIGIGFMGVCGVYFGIKGELNKNTTTNNMEGNDRIE